MPSILEFGARPGAGKPQTRFIQAAIDGCGAAGGGTVLVPAGTYAIGTLALRSHVTLHLENGARLVGSARLEDYPEVAGGFTDAVGQKRNRCLIFAEGCDSVGLSGQGTIDGSGGGFAFGQDERPLLARFVDCANVRVADLTLVDSPSWVCHLLGCENVLVQGVTIRSHANANNDGIDIDSCREVRIASCDLDTGDDAVCIKATRDRPSENIVVTGCVIRSKWAALKLGTESAGDFRNIVFSDILIRDTHGGGLKLISTDGCRMENVHASNIIMDNVSGPIFIRLGARLRKYHADQRGRSAGILRNVSIRNVSGTVLEQGDPLYGKFKRKAGVIVTGIPGHCVEDILFENLRLVFPGGGTAADAARTDVPELEADYPEFPVFHPIPAWGFYIRHARGVVLRDVRIRTIAPDARPPLAVHDVEGLVTGNFP